MTLDVPERVLPLAGAYPTADLDRLLRDLTPLLGLEEPVVLTIDLRHLDGISASSAAVFVAAFVEAAARGMLAPGSQFLLPANSDARNRLEHLGVLELLTEWKPDSERVPPPASGLRPCQVFGTDDDRGHAARSLSLAIAEVCQTESLARDVIWYALNEISQNVVDHSGASGGAVGVAEVTLGGNEIEVAIADFGVGIQTSLQRNPAHASVSNVEALRIAVSAGGSSRVNPVGPAGLGLYCSQLILADNGGRLCIRSGSAELVIGSTSSADPDHEYMRGTLVTLTFRTDKPVRLESILPADEPR